MSLPMISIGRDTAGAAITSITSNGSTYTLANASASGVLQIQTALGGSLTINMLTGAYTYNAPARISGSSASEAFTYMLADGDGGTTSALLSITVTPSGSNPSGSKLKVAADDDAITPLDATFTSAGGVKFVAFKLDYDPELVTVADAEPGADLPDSARISFRTAATDDGAEAYITVTSEDPIPAGTVKLASISVSPRSAGRHPDGLRRLHVQHVNGDHLREAENVRISIADLGLSPSENIKEDIELVDASYAGDDLAPKIRLKVAQFEDGGDPSSAGGPEGGTPSEEDAGDLAAVVKIAIPYAPVTDPSPSPLSLECSHRWKFDRSTDGSAANLPHSVRIPLVSVAKEAFVPASTRM